MEEEGVKGGHKCGRWNPTPEQVKVLTELFRSGLRTPSTEQIQKISSHLSSFGKIESKNVFYWFQNHKARERHHIHTNKKRRRLLQHHHDPKPSTPPPLPSTTTATLTTTTSICAPRTNLFMSYVIGDEQEYREVETLELFPLNSTSGGSEAAASVMRSNNCHYGWFEAAPTAALFSSCTLGGNNRDYLPLDLRLSSL